jgi:hypothetical protein
VSRYDAAREEEKARQALRELDAARKAKEADVQRVRAAKEALDKANAEAKRKSK